MSVAQNLSKNHLWLRKRKTPQANCQWGFIFGATDVTRTHDLLITNHKKALIVTHVFRQKWLFKRVCGKQRETAFETKVVKKLSVSLYFTCRLFALLQKMYTRPAAAFSFSISFHFPLKWKK